MPKEDIETPAATNGRDVAPVWHTALVLVPVAVLSIASWRQQGLPHLDIPGLNTRLSGYLTVLAVECVQAAIILLELRHRRRSLKDLIGGRWRGPREFFRDIGIAVGFVVIALPLGGLMMHFLATTATRNLSSFTPKTFTELILFTLLATVGGGFCEELTFRGYLARQFRGWTHSRLLSVFLQGLIFGLGHGYYGRAMLVVMVQGWLLGALAEWRKSLRPGMLAHGLQNTIGGVVAFVSR